MKKGKCYSKKSLLFCFAIFLLLYSFGCAGLKNGKKDLNNTTIQKPAHNENKNLISKKELAQQTTDQSSYLWLTNKISRELVKQYSTNQIAADEKYKGQIFVIRGTPIRAGDDYGKISVTINYTGWLEGQVDLQCLFDENQREGVSKLKITGSLWENPVAVKCTFKGFDMFGPLPFDNCVFVNDEPPVIGVVDYLKSEKHKGVCLEKHDPDYRHYVQGVEQAWVEVYNSVDECISAGGEISEDID